MAEATLYWDPSENEFYYLVVAGNYRKFYSATTLESLPNIFNEHNMIQILHLIPSVGFPSEILMIQTEKGLVALVENQNVPKIIVEQPMGASTDRIQTITRILIPNLADLRLEREYDIPEITESFLDRIYMMSKYNIPLSDFSHPIVNELLRTPGARMSSVIPFNMLTQLFKAGEIVTYYIDPKITPEGATTGTFVDKSGRVLRFPIRYNPATGKIFPYV